VQLPGGHTRVAAKIVLMYYPMSYFFSCRLLSIDLDVTRAPLQQISKGHRVLDAFVIGSKILISFRLFVGNN
jgi:hypothetical protein